MSRFDNQGDSDGPWITPEMWQHNLKRHLASKRGSQMLRVVREALLAVPGHRLVRDALATPDGMICAVGAVAAYRYKTEIGESWERAVNYLATHYGESYEWETVDVGNMAGLSRTLAWELGYQNDESNFAAKTPESLWWYIYSWVCEHLGEQPDQQYLPSTAAAL